MNRRSHPTDSCLKSNALLQTAYQRFAHMKCHCCQNNAGVCAWKSASGATPTYFFLVFFLLFIKRQRLMLHTKCQPCHRDLHGWSLTLDCFFFNIISQLEVQQTIAHASTCTLAACGDCIMWLWAQVLCGMPVYFLQLIDHMKSSELDFGSQWAREWYRLCECASMCVCAVIHHCIPLSTNRSMATLKLWEPSERRCSSEVFRHLLVHTQIS